MDWTSITHFLHMDGHGFYVWSAYGMATFLVIADACKTPQGGPRAREKRSGARRD